MPSQTLLLAGSIPLAVLLFLVLAAFVFYVFRTRPQQRDIDDDYHERITRLLDRIGNTPPKVPEVFHPTVEGIPPDEVERAFFQFTSTM